MASKKKWFSVLVVTEKHIKVFASDEEEAMEKAEWQLGSKWLAEDAEEISK